MKTRIALVACLVLSLASAAPAEEAYDVVFTRPAKVGDEFELRVVGATRSRMRILTEGQEPRAVNESYGISVDGTVKVLEVNDRGVETKLSLTVASCTAMAGDKAIPLFPEGTVIVSEWNREANKAAYTVDDKELPPTISDVVGLAFRAGDPDAVKEEEIFGSDGKRRPGDVWALNAGAAVKELDRIGLKAKPEDIFGETTLVEASDVEGVPCLRVKTLFKARDLAGPGRDKENPLKLETGTMTVNTTVALPVDPKLPPMKEELKMTITSEMAGKNDEGKEVRVVREMERAGERTIVPVKKGEKKKQKKAGGE